MTIAVCPGSFDPVTNGHVDIVRRAAALFDEVVVAVGVNPSKSRLFGDDERIEMLTAAVEDLDHGLSNVRIASFTGLLTSFCVEQGASVVVKGLRAGTDFDYELQMAQMNAAISPIETVLLPTSPAWSFVSSSLVKEVARFGGDVGALVPDHVLEPLLARLGEQNGQ